MANPNYRPGVFVWRELVTSSVEKAKGYYGELFGWKFTTSDMGSFSYTMIEKDKVSFAGMMPMPEPNPSHWLSYVSVDDVDAAFDRAKREGGKVAVEPRDIPNVGRFAVVGDPDGAFLAIFKSQQGDPPSSAPGVGTFCWETLSTKDVERAKRFYGAVVGWKGVSGPGDIPVFAAGETQVADIQRAQHMPPNWLTYVVVEKIEDANVRVAKLGGKVVEKLIEVPSVGRISLTQDPTGAFLGLFQPEQR